MPARLQRHTGGKRLSKEKEIIENADVKQGKLNIGYRTNMCMVIPIIMPSNCSMGFLEVFHIQSFSSMFGKKRALPIMLPLGWKVIKASNGHGWNRKCEL